MLDIIKEIKQWQLDWEGWFADRRLPQPPDMETFARKLEEKYIVNLRSDLNFPIIIAELDEKYLTVYDKNKENE